MATQNSINKKTQDLTVDPGASGDSFLQFDINTTGEFRIGVDDTDDSFRISQGSALGTNDTFVMTAAGERTMPLQPAFLAELNTEDSNATGDGTVFTLGSGNALTEVYDQGGDFVTTGTFTAPVTGKYLITVGVHVKGLDLAVTSYQVNLITSNGTYRMIYVNPGAIRTPAWHNSTMANFHCDMDASDTATVTITASAGAKVVDVLPDNRNTLISGYLIC